MKWLWLLLIPLSASAQVDVEQLQLNVTISAPVSGSSFNTTFDGTEALLSESGFWHNDAIVVGAPDLKAPNQMEKFSGVAYQVLGPNGGGHFGDEGLQTQQPLGSYDGAAHLSGFPPDQWAEVEMVVGAVPSDVQEGTVMVRANTYPAGALTHNNPTTGTEQTRIRMYAAYWNTHATDGAIGIGLWDGNMLERGDPYEAPGHVFYGNFGQNAHPFSTCRGKLATGDRIRVTIQGASPATMKAYLKRLSTGTWETCGTVLTTGVTIPWHQQLTSGNPGISSYQNNVTVRTTGYTSFAAGTCPPLPASCAP